MYRCVLPPIQSDLQLWFANWQLYRAIRHLLLQETLSLECGAGSDCTLSNWLIAAHQRCCRHSRVLFSCPSSSVAYTYLGQTSMQLQWFGI